jgi:hypothetical protein
MYFLVLLHYLNYRIYQTYNSQIQKRKANLVYFKSRIGFTEKMENNILFSDIIVTSLKWLLC